MSMEDLPKAYRDLPRWAFGDNPKLADELLALVLSGTKTATCCHMGFEPKPVLGERSLVLDGSGRPACIIETTEVTIRRFDEVDGAFAHEEGEGNRTLESWRRNHEIFFRRNGVFSEDMLLYCERFHVVDVLRPMEATP